MKVFAVFLLLGLSSVWGQSAVPVVAVYDDGFKLTLDDYKSLIQTHPSWQSLPKEQVLHEYGLLRKAAKLFDQQGLGEKSPYKEALAFDSMYQLANCWTSNAAKVEPADVEAFYEQNKGAFRMFKMSGIRIAFGGTPAPETSSPPVLASRPVKKILTDEEAKAKATSLLAEIRAGGDFHKLLLLNSDDSSKQKDGELGTWSLTDNIPVDLRQAAFGLKEGEVSEPVRQADGYWLLHVDAITYKPLSELKDALLNQMLQAKGNEAMTDLDKNIKLDLPKTDAAAEKGDTAIAVFEDGGKMTLDEYRTLLKVQPTWQSQERAQVIRRYAVLRKAAALAGEQKLAEKSPYKEALAFNLLYQKFKAWGQETENAAVVAPAEIENYYNGNKNRFMKVKVSGLKVAYGDAAGSGKSSRKPLTEQQAKAKADKLVAEARAGADFAKLVLRDSDDQATKAKGGDLGSWGPSDNVAEDLRNAVSGLHVGEVTEPVSQPGGYWLVHVDAINYQPLTDVRDSIFEQLRTAKVRDLFNALDKSVGVTIPKEGDQAAVPADPKQ